MSNISNLISHLKYNCDNFFIEPVILYDKFIDAAGLNVNLVCIFRIIIKKSKMEET